MVDFARISYALMLASAVLLLGPTATAQAATFTVTSTSDAGPGSLRSAISQANDPANQPTAPHLIDATGVGGTIGLTSPLPGLTSDVEIRGPGARQLTVRRLSSELRIFTVVAGYSVEISGLTISGGIAEFGGGIQNHGTLTLRQSTVTGNLARRGGGGIHNQSGTLTVEESTVADNDAHRGGGIESVFGGRTTIVNSTVSGNRVASRGGGIWIAEGGHTLALAASTVARNDAAYFQGVNLGLSNSPGAPPTRATIRSTILAESAGGGPQPPNCQIVEGALVSSTGYNLSDDSSCGLDQPTDLPGGEAGLAPLAANGGPTDTHALNARSAAIDKGIAATGIAEIGTLRGDQRGQPRPFVQPNRASAAGGDGSDIGAFEVQERVGPLRIALRIQGRKLTINRRGLSFATLACRSTGAGPCQGRLTIRTQRKLRFRGKRRHVVLARSGFSVPAGETRRVRLKLVKAQLRLVRSQRAARRAQAVARVRDQAGNRARVVKRMRLVVARRR